MTELDRLKFDLSVSKMDVLRATRFTVKSKLVPKKLTQRVEPILTRKLRKIAGEQHLYILRKQHGKYFLTRSRNVVQKNLPADVYRTDLAELARDLQAEPSPRFTRDIRQLPKELRLGVCQGAVLDLAKTTLHLQSSIKNSDQFHNALVAHAQGYSNGIGTAGVVNHVMYKSLCEQKLAQQDQLQVALNNMKLNEIEKKLALLVINPREAGQIHLSDIQEIGPLAKIMIKHPSCDEVVRFFKENNHPELAAFFSEHADAYHLLHPPQHTYTVQPSGASPINPSFSTQQRTTNTLETRKAYPLIGNAPGQTMTGRVAQARGMKLDPYGQDTVDDSGLLNRLNDAGDGAYNLTFDVGSGRHAVLFIKNGNDAYLWDPNVGLIQCPQEKKPAQLIDGHMKSHYPLLTHQLRIYHIKQRSP